jgi:hypothetical protein
MMIRLDPSGDPPRPVGGVIVPFVGLKALDVLLVALHLARASEPTPRSATARASCRPEDGRLR